MNFQHGLKLLVAGFLNYVVPAVARVVDDDIDCSESGKRGFDQLIGKRGLDEVANGALDAASGIAQCTSCFTKRGLVEVVHHYGRPSFGQLGGDGAPNAPSGAGDQRNLALKGKGRFNCFGSCRTAFDGAHSGHLNSCICGGTVHRYSHSPSKPHAALRYTVQYSALTPIVKAPSGVGNSLPLRLSHCLLLTPGRPSSAITSPFYNSHAGLKIRQDASDWASYRRGGIEEVAFALGEPQATREKNKNLPAQNKTSPTRFESLGRLLISPPPSAAQEGE